MAVRNISYSKPSTPKKPASASRPTSSSKPSTSSQTKQAVSAPKRDTFTYSSQTTKQTAAKTSTTKTSTAPKTTQTQTSTTKTNTPAKTNSTKSTTTKSTSAASNKNRDTFTYTSPAAKTAVKLTQKGTVSATKNTKVSQTKTAVKNNTSDKTAVSGSLTKNKTKSAQNAVPEGLKLHLKHTTDPKQKAAMQKTIEIYNRKFPVSLDIGDISADYGHTDNGVHKKGHKGVDISAPAGTPISSITDGEVVGVFDNETQGYRGYGNSVLVKGDDNMYYFYAHMDNVDVAVGDTVGCGDILGGVGSTGNSTGNHLHFEIRTGGAWDSSKVNPHDYIIYYHQK